MGFYRKRPVVIEAVKWAGDNIKEVLALPRDIDVSQITVNWDNTLSIKTLEGVMLAELGDFIVCGIKGELYPCKPDIFEQTYEDCDASRRWSDKSL